MSKNNRMTAGCRNTGTNKAIHKRNVILIMAGQLCPHCGFARLQKEPGGIIKCPICGFGPNNRFT
jgi:ribosomal protein L37AE/L43A